MCPDDFTFLTFPLWYAKKSNVTSITLYHTFYNRYFLCFLLFRQLFTQDRREKVINRLSKIKQYAFVTITNGSRWYCLKIYGLICIKYYDSQLHVFSECMHNRLIKGTKEFSTLLGKQRNEWKNKRYVKSTYHEIFFLKVVAVGRLNKINFYAVVRRSRKSIRIGVLHKIHIMNYFIFIFYR